MKDKISWIKNMWMKAITNLWIAMFVFIAFTIFLSLLDSYVNGWNLFLWFELLVNLVSSFSLPIAVIIVASIFKKPIFDLLNRTKKITSKYFDSEFISTEQKEINKKEVEELSKKSNVDVGNSTIFTKDESDTLSLIGEVILYPTITKSNIKQKMSENLNVVKFLFEKQMEIENTRNNGTNGSERIGPWSNLLIVNNEKIDFSTPEQYLPVFEGLEENKFIVTSRGVELIMKKLTPEVLKDYDLLDRLNFSASAVARPYPYRGNNISEETQRKVNKLNSLLEEFTPGAIKILCDDIEKKVIDSLNTDIV